MFWWKVIISVSDQVNTDLLSDWLFSNQCGGLDEKSEKEFHAFFPGKVEKGKILETLEDFREKYNSDIDYIIEVQKEENWQDNWKDNFVPIEIPDKFIILAPWHEVTSRLPGIVIDPNLAFGTGGHESTRIMLNLLNRELMKDRKVLDIGCGSGILSFAASILGVDEVLGIDVDCVAVDYAVRNLNEFNSFGNVELRCGEISGVKGEYDIVFMNIISSIQKKILPHIAGVMKSPGYLLTSGVLVEEKEEYEALLTEAGYEKKLEKIENEWIGYLFER